jgi:hypothetical protein
MEFKKRIPHDIHISASANGGFLVQVGCVNLVYVNKDALVSDLNKYLHDPEGVAKVFNDMRLNCGTGGHVHNTSPVVQNHPVPDGQVTLDN